MKCSAVPGYRWLVLLGGFLIHLTLGSFFSHGNMAPYIISYTRAKSIDAGRDIVTLNVSPWLNGCAVTAHAISMILGGWMSHKLGARLTALIGCTVFTASVLLTAAVINLSFWAVVVTYGIMFGIGIGITYMAPLAAAIQWFPERRGLAIGLVLSGLGLSSFIIIPIQTGFINPNNLTPNFRPDSRVDFTYFTQSQVLERIPFVFLLLGGMYLIIQTIGILLIVEPVHVTHIMDSDFSPFKKFWLIIKPHYSECCCIHVNPKDEDEIELKEITEENSKQEESAKEQSNEILPFALLQRWDFYAIWFAFAAIGEAVVYLAAIYKIFGQGFILNDHTLAIVGSIGALSNSVGRILWGILADVLPCKLVLIIIFGGEASLMYTFYSTSVVGLPLYFTWTALLFFFAGGAFVVFPACTANWYGAKNVGTNYGLLFTSQILSSLIAILISTLTHHYIRWIGQMMIGASFTFIGLLLIIIAGDRTVKEQDNTKNNK